MQLAGSFPVLTQHALIRLVGVLNLHDMAVTPTRLVEAFRQQAPNKQRLA